ncbi:hypothetical protein J1N35_011811 [Gossypium stocksii]|uniref:Uncharacterized protein n=1 Tax=Gossypium stocksii TaxID=47602 RepID=A0A9D4ADQ7_9ROSI|nr:hypothetical protein J1N35_011811 [Gossypium stocksii]
MPVSKYLIELVSRKDKFESSKPNEKENIEGDGEGYVKDENDGNVIMINYNRKWKPNNKPNKSVECFLCYGILDIRQR